MARKPLTAVTGLLVLGTALLTIVPTGAFAQDAAANPCEKAWPYNAGCKGAAAPADGRKVRLITTNPLSLRKDEPAQQPAAQQPAQPPVVAPTERAEEPQQQPTASRRRNNPFLALTREPQQPSVEPSTDTQPEPRPTPRILQRAPARPQAADVEPEQQPERFERPDRLERRERTERFERFEQPERFDRQDRSERKERVERTPGFDRQERFERVERPERVERSDRFERNRPNAEERFERGGNEFRDRRGPVAWNDEAPRRERRWCMRGGREFPCPW